ALIRASTAPGTASASVSSTISARTPEAGAGTSCVTLSVSSSTSGSFSNTRSPTCRSHERTTAFVPSCSSGTTTSIMSEPHQPLDLGADGLCARKRPFHQLGMMRARDIRHGHARNRRVEVEESLVRNHRRDLRAEPAGAPIFVDDQAASRAAHAVEHHFLVPRLKCAQVDHIGAEALRGSLAAGDHRTPRYDGNLVAFAR